MCFWPKVHKYAKHLALCVGRVSNISQLESYVCRPEIFLEKCASCLGKLQTSTLINCSKQI